MNGAATDRLQGLQDAPYAAQQPMADPRLAGTVECQPIQRLYAPDALDLDALADLLVELVNLPEGPVDSACFPATPMESCG